MWLGEGPRSSHAKYPLVCLFVCLFVYNIKLCFLEVFQLQSFPSHPFTNILPGKSTNGVFSHLGIIPTLNHFHPKCSQPQLPGDLATARCSPFPSEECFLLNIYCSVFTLLSRHIRHRTRVKVIWVLNSVLLQCSNSICGSLPFPQKRNVYHRAWTTGGAS